MVVEPYASVIIGSVGAFVYCFFSWLLLWLQIDDPLEAFPIHGGVGGWGLIATGLFATSWGVAEAGFNSEFFGLFYGGGGKLLGANIIALLSVVTWTIALLGPFFFILRITGILRIPYEEEMRGNDFAKHGGEAYTGMDKIKRQVVAHEEYDNPDDNQLWDNELAAEDKLDEVDVEEKDVEAEA